MKIYISGPITGTNDYMERFAKAQKYLESKGFSVVNPALVNSNLPEDTTYEEYMRMSFTMLDMCDHIYMLSGYGKSAGALMELSKAYELDLNVLYEKTLADMYPVDFTPEEIAYIKNDINALFGASL